MKRPRAGEELRFKGVPLEPGLSLNGVSPDILPRSRIDGVERSRESHAALRLYGCWRVEETSRIPASRGRDVKRYRHQVTGLWSHTPPDASQTLRLSEVAGVRGRCERMNKLPSCRKTGGFSETRRCTRCDDSKGSVWRTWWWTEEVKEICRFGLRKALYNTFWPHLQSLW